MNSQPKVSLLIPIYNAEASIRLCLDSAAAQTLPELEILCLNDGSTDDSAAVCREYAERDGRFRLLQHEENRGSMEARKTLTEAARGEYIMFLDADDVLKKDACARAYERICREKTEIVQFGLAVDAAPWMPEETARWFQRFSAPCCRRLHGTEILSACFLDREMSWNLVNKIYAAPLLKRAMEYVDFSEPIIHGEDLYISFAVFCLANSFAGFSDKLYRYRYGYGLTGSAITLETFEKLRGQALVDARLYRLTEELGGPRKRREAYFAAARALIDDSVGKLARLSGEEREEGMRRLLLWWRDSPSRDTLRRRMEDTFAVCLDTGAPAPGEKAPVAVVFAANAGYVTHAAAAVASVAAHAAPDRTYRLYVLHDSIPAADAQRLEGMSRENIHVRCLNIAARIRESVRRLPTLRHITAETWFRFYIPEVFPYFDKVLYLDCDLVAEADVGELFDTPMGDALLGGAVNVCKTATEDRLARDFCISHGKYVNAGVLLFHNALLRRESVNERFFRFMETVPPELLFYSDQDVLNAVCKDRIVYFDSVWNFCWNHIHGDPELAERARGEVERVLPRIRICHFAGPLKPWTDPDLELADRYWKYAALTPFFADELHTAVREARLPEDRQNETYHPWREAAHRFFSGRPGRLLTWIPRKIRGFFACIREHGWSFTWRRAIEHFGIPMGALLPRKGGKKKPLPPPPLPPAFPEPAPPPSRKGRSLVSVIVPVYNAALYLPECLASLQRQTYPDLEILCVDDGSTDDSAAVIARFADKDDRIRYIRQEHRSAGAARNAALAEARGEYLAFLDADDYYDPCFVETMAARAEALSADVVVCDEYQHRQDTGEDLLPEGKLRVSLLRGYEVFSRRELPEEILVFTTPEPWNKLYRRAFVEENGLRFQDLPRSNDVLFTYSSIAMAERICYVNQRLVNNRRGMQTNLQSNNGDTPLAFYEAFSALRSFLEERGIYGSLARSYGNLCLDNALYGLNNLTGEAREEAVSFLREEGFRRLNIRPHSRAFFYDRENYRRLRELLDPAGLKRGGAYYASLSPEQYPEELILWYESRTGDELPLDDPVTFNEKLQWLKLYDATPEKTRLADKYRVRDWVKDTIGEEHLIPLLGVWERFEDIDFDALPEQFVLKANDGSGRNIIVKDKAEFDAAGARAKFARWASEPFAFDTGFEMHYLNIPPRIIAEKYMENMDQLVDYKFMCFGGEVKFIWVDTDRYTRHRRTLFTTGWERMDVTIGEYAPAPGDIPRPERLGEMIAMATTLSRGFAHVRVDFYEVDGRVYFGEMTFTSTSGLDRAWPRSFEKTMGDWLTLPEPGPIPVRETDDEREKRTQ